jgi:uncharacterized protein YcbK (DUF882 family)
MRNYRLSRRHLLGGALALGGLSLVPQTAFAALPERRLAFRNVHNSERVDVRYYGAGGFDPDGLAEINHALRDWRTGDIAEMDTDLLDLLVAIREKLDVAPRRPFDLISGYRSPTTNAMLREHGGGGVASRSQHLLGRATDIALPGISLDRIRMAAMSEERGGVGYYPNDGFVHVDTGRVRSW